MFYVVSEHVSIQFCLVIVICTNIINFVLEVLNTLLNLILYCQLILMLQGILKYTDLPLKALQMLIPACMRGNNNNHN